MEKKNVYVICKQNIWHIMREYIISYCSQINAIVLFNTDEQSFYNPEIDATYIYVQHIPQRVLNEAKNTANIWLLNTEQCTRPMFQNMILNVLQKGFRVIDYSAENMHVIEKVLDPSLLQNSLYHLPYQNIKQEIQNNVEKEYDVMFYGWPSPRRTFIIKEMEDAGLKLKVCDWTYSEARDIEIAKSKIILNLHFNADYNIFEHIRCDRLVFSNMLVLSEPSCDMDKVDMTELIFFEVYQNMTKKARHMIDNYELYCSLFQEKKKLYLENVTNNRMFLIFFFMELVPKQIAWKVFIMALTKEFDPKLNIHDLTNSTWNVGKKWKISRINGKETRNKKIKMTEWSVKHNKALVYYKKKDYTQALRLWDEVLERSPWSEEKFRLGVEVNRRMTIEDLRNSFSEYPWQEIQDLIKQQEKKKKDKTLPTLGVTLFVLTCKRFDLFTRTMNSFIRCCEDRDLITRWICIDDNSHPNDRAIMKSLYPFMEFVFKSVEDVGHAKSMNIARNMITTPYVIALEDDWQFVTKMKYIERSLCLMEREPDCVKQVFFNRHYIEIPDDAYLVVTGGIKKEDAIGRRYYIHEYIPFESPGYREYKQRFPVNFSHQPHFALRPSFFKRDLWNAIGPFNEEPTLTEFHYFENDYGRRYVAEGFVSAYFDGVYCIHTGRLNRDRKNPNAPPNAYQLNNMEQYGQLWPSAMVGKSAKETTEKIALTVTTCKRLDSFLVTMCSVLSMCKDPHLIDRFIIIDDNSSAEDRQKMECTFPFFEIIEKGPAEKGHAKSMNLILDQCKDYDYIFQNEDDFNFKQQYSISDALFVIKKGEFDQVTMMQHPGCRVNPTKVGNVTIWPHVHNLRDNHCPLFFHQLRDKVVSAADMTFNNNNSGCWWPNFSLNPSLLRVKSFGNERYNETIDPTFFEYEMALRLWKKNNYKTCSLGLKIEHATEVSAYVLNQERRLFDGAGCGNHRAVGGDPKCAACKLHKQ